MAQYERVRGGAAERRLRIGGLALLVVAALLLVGSTWYTVDPEEVAVVTRFGRYVRSEPPGAHFKLPWGIEEAHKVRVSVVRKAEFGFRTADPGIGTVYSDADFGDELHMLTGDLNQADVEWTVQYRVSDPVAFLFHVREPEGTLRTLAESTMRSVVGDHSIDEVLGLARTEIDDRARVLLQEALDLYGAGIDVERVNLQNVLPPKDVKPAFEAVNMADQNRMKLINDARRMYSERVPAARGQAEQTITAAEGYKIDRVNRALGEAERFTKVLAEYAKAPDVTRRRLYLEVMNDVLPRISRTIVVDEGLQGLLPLLELDGPDARRAPEAGTPGGGR